MPARQPNTLNRSEHPVAHAVPASVRRIVLTGFMGAGKSTVGRLLASRLGWNFLDLDTHIENRTGATIAELFSHYGESHFRRLESTALASALSRPDTVLALGGGAPEEITNRLLIEQTPATLAIFLDAPFPTLFDRCMLQEIARPVLADPAVAEQRFARRRPLYARLAHITVETSSHTPQTTVESILQSLNQTPHLRR
ncbi:shikimate kinase [Edaphobacter flagellatus]|uniref:shikimate kinase n=1 Tax=Edaphobacter flagellatus TaxID=1933044 RepID=UPI0021B24877|nr:shikimate kinase [Edaphobacter flagellatus]